MKRFVNRLVLPILALAILAPLAWSSGAPEGGSTKAGEVVQIRMFMGDSGVPAPSGVDISNSWIINIIEKYAGVDILLEIPGYQDFATKLNLLLASGNLPDVIHGWMQADMEKAADAGAFLDLKPYYEKSPQMQKVVSAVAFDLAKSPGGKNWAIPMTTTGMEPGSGNLIRYDLLKEYNGYKFPETVEGYMDFLRWVKKQYPDSIPFSPQTSGETLFTLGNTFFMWHGVAPYGRRLSKMTLVDDITLPEYTAAVEVYRKLYADNVLDKEFTNNPSPKFWDKVKTKRVAMYTNGIDQIVPIIDVLQSYTGSKEGYFVFTPQLAKLPAGVDVRYTQSTDVWPIISHRVGISAKTKYPAQAWKVLEGFASDELRSAQAWGREGKEYTVANGKRVPTDKLYASDPQNPDSHYWSLIYGIIWGFWPTDVKYEVQRLKVGDEVWNNVYGSSRWIIDAARKNGPSYTNMVVAIPGVSEKAGERNALISQIVAKYITGETTLDQYKAAVADFAKKYEFMNEATLKQIKEKAEAMRKAGIKNVDW